MTGTHSSVSRLERSDRVGISAASAEALTIIASPSFPLSFCHHRVERIMTGGPSNTRARRAFVPRIHRVGRSSSAPPAHGGYANLPRLARSRYKSYYVWGVLMILFSCAPIFGPSLACTMSSVLPNIHGEDNVWNHRKAIAWTVAGV